MSSVSQFEISNAISLQKTEGFPWLCPMQLRRSHTNASRSIKIGVACHCLDCQRRTGAPFGVAAFYPADAVAISGTSKEFTRDAASGGRVHTYFCPDCGSTIYWKADNRPALNGVAVGALADPKYPAPIRSVFEQSKHNWVQIDGAVEHFQQSSVAKIQTVTLGWELSRLTPCVVSVDDCQRSI